MCFAEGLAELLIQLGTVCQEDQFVIPQQGVSTDLLGEKDHGEGLARSLGMPYDSTFALTISRCLESLNALLDCPELLVAGDLLNSATFISLKDREVLNNV